MDNTDTNDVVLNVYLNILQDNLTYNKKIFSKITIIVIVYGLNHRYLCMNTLFNWFGWIKYRNDNNSCTSR